MARHIGSKFRSILLRKTQSLYGAAPPKERSNQRGPSTTMVDQICLHYYKDI